ncbi:MAG TPA: NAD(P)H-binding protein [Thermomicrobiales bacterium]|nr:NAD(P)H-binding protein [Thermomicrobiales bacterium]
MTAPILVTGGTGTLGSHVVRRLREAGREVRVLSRSGRKAGAGIQYVTGDLATGEGIDAAVEGVEVIMHLAGSAKGDEIKTRNLVLAAASQPQAPHLVYISVVGADRPTFSYFASKLASEEIVIESGLPWTILRATQFHDLMLKVGEGMAKLPVIPTPSGFRFQPIEADEVAARLVELALGEPAGRVPDIAGPQVFEMAELVRGYLRASHRRRLIVPVWLPGRAAREFRAGANLAPERSTGRRTWEEFLATRLV